jgi:hypothetical protein
MSGKTSVKYYVSWEDWAETIPLTLFRTIADAQGYPEDEQFWNKKDLAWLPTTRVTENMFEGGDLTLTTLEFAQQHFPAAFKG